jgi:NAD(P)-dependent dehydrogenase (short-subunit alcohol dehydrogenase family)
MNELAGKVALVTGGSRGLGRAIVEAYAAHGADVVIASRKYDRCAALAASITARLDRRALPLACNVSDWTECDALVDAAYTEFGHVDVLVNDAGMSPGYASLGDVSRELFDKVIAVNLAGPFRLSALIGPRMADAGGGAIINISSIAAIRPTPDAIPYAAAKAGLNAMTEGLAKAFGPFVRVNAIQAGPFLTDTSKAWDMDAFRRSAESSIALQRAGHPEEIAGAALFLASSASSYCSGTVLRLDGGTA